jgi:hypothetical protein
MGDYLMKVVINFIGTGKYLNFLPAWYEKVTENFLPDCEKTFLVFTDGEGDFPEDIKVYKQEHLEWPYITLKRFDILQSAREEIEKADWFVFLDADLMPVEKIYSKDFFDKQFSYFGVHHPCHFLKMPPHTEFPGSFDVNPLSLAGISSGDDTSVYYQGCLWGGKVPDILTMIDQLKNNVEIDISNNIIAKWHDESHLNKFFIENKGKVNTLHPQYAFPELFAQYCEFKPMMLHLSKDNSQFHV